MATHSTADGCELDVSPKNWASLLKRSRWDDDKTAITVIHFNIPFDKARRKMGFEQDEQGAWGMAGRQGDFSKAVDVTYPHFAGIRAEPWFRGFAREGSELGEQSRIYSGNFIAILLHGKRGEVVGVRFNAWSPDIPVNRDAAAQVILRSLRSDPAPR